MRAFDPDPNLRWLFCMGHPDDEAAVGAWIHFLRSQGNEVGLCWTHSNATREAEGKAAAEILKVRPSDLFFLGFPDGEAIRHLEPLHEAHQDVIRTFRPDRIACVAFEQGHLDHDATNLSARAAFNGPVTEWPMYHAYLRRFQWCGRFADESGQETRAVLPDEREVKNRLLNAYPSQGFKRNVILFEALSRLLLNPAHLGTVERMRVCLAENYLSPNLPEPLRSKVAQCTKWQTWLHHAAPFLSAHPICR